MLQVGDKKISRVYHGSAPVKRVYVGNKLVWQDREVLKIPGNVSASKFLKDALSARGLDYKTVTELPFDLDTSQVTDMRDMFYGCSALMSVPSMSTGQVKYMMSMFSRCSSLISAPPMDTSQVTDMTSMFYGCSSLTSVPAMNTGQVKYMISMFNGCSSLKDGKARLIGKHPVVDTSNMIKNSGLTREPFFDQEGNPI